jgi:hypothetical protein
MTHFSSSHDCKEFCNMRKLRTFDPNGTKFGEMFK